MNVHWTEAALADLRAAQEYLARHSPQYAQGLVDRIFDKAGELATQPLLGAEVPEYGEETLRELFEHPYRIIYRVLENQVDIVAVVHASRGMPRGL
jgi:toxin ParE1/3/4